MVELWGNKATWNVASGEHPHEAHFLSLDTTKARVHLGWESNWTLDQSLKSIVEWDRESKVNSSCREMVEKQIKDFLNVV
jgi:CDP-glucose 4,6-dehydratase